MATGTVQITKKTWCRKLTSVSYYVFLPFMWAGVPRGSIKPGLLAMSKKKVSEQLARIAVLQNLDLVLAQFDLDVESELASMGLDIAMLRDGDLLINLQTVTEILEHCAEMTQCPGFSLRLAAAQDVTLLGVLALFMQTCSSLGEALREISQYNHVHHAQSVTWRLDNMSSAVKFSFHLDAEGLSAVQQRLAIDLGLGHAYNVIDTLTGGRIHPQRVLLHSDQSMDVQSYRQFFHAPVEFNAEMDGLLLPPDCLDFPLVHPDPKMHEALRDQISAIDGGEDSASLVHEVRTIIRAFLPTGDCSLGRVARCYACDRRTLQRYLREEADTTFQALLDDVRFELVQQYLRDSNMPVTQITFAAGFSDPSNFARAFRKRFGLSPQAWRAKHNDTPGVRTMTRPQLLNRAL